VTETAANAVNTVMNTGTTQAFSEEAVPAEDIQTILRAGLASESVINPQPWYSVAITDKAVMAEISGAGGRLRGAGMPLAPNDGSMPEPPQSK
jgi:nitroreductase